MHPDRVVISATAGRRLRAPKAELAELARGSVALAGAGASAGLAREIGATLLEDDPVTAAERIAEGDRPPAEADLERGASRAARPARSQRCTEPRCGSGRRVLARRRGRLGDLYWLELDRSMFGLVRARVCPRGRGAQALGIGPALVRLGRGEPIVTPDSVTFRYAILGGSSSALRATGSRSADSRLPARSSLRGRRLLPALAARRVRRGWRGVLYPPADPPSRRPRATVLRTSAHGGRPVKVAVLGATGMVGRSLVPLLAERDDVVAVSRRRRRRPAAYAMSWPTSRIARRSVVRWKAWMSCTTSSAA